MKQTAFPDYATLRRRYEAYLLLERGLSENTREAYLADADRLQDFLRGRGVDFDRADVQTLSDFVASLADLGIAPRSIARTVSGIKSVFRYLRLEREIDANPALLLDTPRIGRHLPTVLSVGEIDSMIAAIDPESPTALRNHAIIETLYGCGLRVSELCDMRLSRIDFTRGMALIEGKGSKERIVPMSDSSLELIRRYGIRVSELGDFSMEYDLKTPEQQAELANVVRFAIDRSRLTQEHLDYVIAAVKALYEDRESIPNMRIVWGHKLPMRHFHAFLELSLIHI